MNTRYFSLVALLLTMAFWGNNVSAVNYYNKSTGQGSLNLLASWGTNTDGSGTAPTSFTIAADTFHIVNGTSFGVTAAWTVSGANSRIILETGNLIVNGLKITGTLNLFSATTLTVSGSVTNCPTLGVLDKNSTVIYNGSGTGNIPASKTFGNLVISRNMGLTGTTTTKGVLTLNSNLNLNGRVLNIDSTLIANGSAFFLITSGGTVAYRQTLGTQNVLAGAYANLTLSGAATKIMPVGTISLDGTFSAPTTTSMPVGSLFIYNNSTFQDIEPITYYNLTVKPEAALSGNGTVVKGVLSVDNLLDLNAFNFRMDSSAVLNTALAIINASNGGTVTYGQASNGQVILANQYVSLTCSGGAKILPADSVAVSGAFTNTSTLGSATAGSRFIFNGAGNQTITAFNYYNLEVTKPSGTAAYPTGTISVAGSFSESLTGTATRTVNAGNIINYNGTTNQNIVQFPYQGLTISNTVNCKAPTDSLYILRNFTNNGNFDANNGVIVFLREGTQNIAGNKPTVFNHVTVRSATSTGIKYNEIADLKITGVLEIKGAAVFDADGTAGNKKLTLVSTLSNTASLAPLVAAGKFQGTLTMQQFVSSTVRRDKAGFRDLSSPVTAATMAQWDDNLYTSGLTGSPDGFAGDSGDFFSIVYFDETVASTTVDNYDGYNNVTNVTTTITPGRGYEVYTRNDPTDLAGDITIDVTGTPNKGTITLPVTFTNVADPGEDGWNLVGNPYPSAIDWNHASWTKTNIKNAIYVYNPDYGDFVLYEGGTSTPPVSGGGISNIIPAMQGFWVQATAAAPSLKVSEAAKTRAQASFLSNANTVNYVQFITSRTGTSEVSYATVKFNDAANDSVDALDSKQISMPTTKVSIFSMIGTDRLISNCMTTLGEDKVVDLRVMPRANGTYTLAPVDFANLDAAYCVIIEDLSNGTFTDLHKTPAGITFTGTADVEQKFRLYFSLPSNLSLNVKSTDLICEGDANAAIQASATGKGSYNFVWTKDNQVVRTQTTIGKDTLANLAAGVYMVEVTKVGSCAPSIAQTITISTPAALVAQFDQSADTVQAGQNTTVTFTSTSLNADTYEWNLGDGSATQNTAIASHTYTTPGTYTVTLNATKSACNETKTATSKIVVKDVALSIANANQTNLIQVSNNETSVWINFMLPVTTPVSINMVNLIGQSVMPAIQTSVSNQRLELTLPTAQGIYLLTIQTPSGSKVVRILKN